MSQPPPVEGIVESILYVDDLPRAVAFYRDELGFVPMTGDPARFQSFSVGGRQVLLLFKQGPRWRPRRCRVA
jgi:catechol 2,3-dioxygenase-like lactoylglutathione lyase family enzyme